MTPEERDFCAEIIAVFTLLAVLAIVAFGVAS